MAKNYVMVIDEGTTGTRSLIFDKSLNIIASSYTEFTQYTPASDKVEHDAMEIYDKSIQMCRQAMEQASISSDDIACIGITNQRNTFVLWDKNTGLPIHHAIVWQDSRCGEMADRLASEQIGKDTFAATGKKLCTYQPVLPIRWLMDNVDGIESQVNSGDILFGTIDCWLILETDGGRCSCSCQLKRFLSRLLRLKGKEMVSADFRSPEGACIYFPGGIRRCG